MSYTRGKRLISQRLRIGIVVPELRGHLNASLSLGDELRRRGHEVTFFARLDAKALIEEQGLRCVTFAEKDCPLGSSQTTLNEIGRNSGMKAFKKMLNYYRNSSKFILRDLPLALQQEKVDLLLIDQTYRAATAVADLMKIPFFTLCIALNMIQDLSHPPIFMPWMYKKGSYANLRNKLGYKILERTVEPLDDLITKWKIQKGLPIKDRLHEFNSQHLILTQELQEFDLPRKNHIPQVAYVGPFVNSTRFESTGFPWGKLGEQPYVYASLGTIQNRIEKVFQTIAKVFQNAPLRLVISAGGGIDLSKVELVGDPIVVNYAPQLQLIQKAQMVITHAGMNTTMEALKFGKPLLAIPITNDQPGIGARIQFHKCGETLFLKNVSVRTLREKVDRVLFDPVYREKAQFYSEKIFGAGGSPKACELIEEAAHRLDIAN